MAIRVINVNGIAEPIADERDFEDLVLREMGDEAAEEFQALLDEARGDQWEYDYNEAKKSEEQLVDHQTALLNDILEELNALNQMISAPRTDKKKALECITNLRRKIMAEL